MTAITLPPEIEETMAQQAQRQGTTTELLALDTLRRYFPPSAESTEGQAGESLYDMLKDHIGVIHSSENVSGGAQMATDSGRKFAAGMAQKQSKGQL